MTKKDYIAIAGVLRRLGENGVHCFDSPDDRRVIALRFASILARDNPAFDQSRFLDACLPALPRTRTKAPKPAQDLRTALLSEPFDTTEEKRGER